MPPCEAGGGGEEGIVCLSAFADGATLILWAQFKNIETHPYPMPRFRFLIPLFAGALTTLALPPYGWWIFLFVGMGMFYATLTKLDAPKQAFRHGWLFGFGYFLSGLWWIGNALLIDGNPYIWAYPLALVGLPIILALYPALTCAAAVKWSALKTLRGLLVFTAFMGIAEWLRGHLFTGFPWNLYAYGWSGALPMMQIVSVVGSYGLTFLTIFWGAAAGFLTFADKKTALKIAPLAALSILAVYGFGVWRIHAVDTDATQVKPSQQIVVRPIQPNIAQTEKWDADRAWNNYVTLLNLAKADHSYQGTSVVLVFPETALSSSLLQNDAAKNALRQTLATYDSPVYLFAGILHKDIGADGKITYGNSLSVFDHAGMEISRYDKSHLVPFGEYIPFSQFIPLDPIVNFSGFTTGKGVQTQHVDGLPSFSPLICYEVIFGGNVTQGNPRPSWIVNVTNDGWYGDSPGPYQHFAQARFRAIEEGISVVRSANTGLSGVIDPLGREVYRSTLMTQDAPDVMLPMFAMSQPIYSRLVGLFQK
jgi:apolipoprotein N-acyltransferase